MKYRLKRIGVQQTGVVTAAIYGGLGLLFVPVFLLMSLAATHHAPGNPQHPAPSGFPWWLGLLFPVLYAIVGFLFGAFSAAIYNLSAHLFGGIEVTVEERPGQT